MIKVICPAHDVISCYEVRGDDYTCADCGSLCEVQSQSYWTPVGKGLPKGLGVEYLCQVKGLDGDENYQCVAWFSFEKQWRVSLLDQAEYISDRIIAWQPRPEPYVPPVKLPESCSGCKYLDEIKFRSGEEITKHVDHCIKHGICGTIVPFVTENGNSCDKD